LNYPKASPSRAIGNHHEAILEEAGKCLLEEGFQKTTMRALASRLGLSRQTIYRNFENRDDLLTALFMHEYHKGLSKIKNEINNRSFEDSVLFATLKTIEVIHENDIMMEIAYGSGIKWYQEQNLNRDSYLYKRVIQIGEEVWRDLLNNARQAGKLNPDLSNLEVFEWLMNIHYLMIARKGITLAEHASMVRKLLIPSLMT
jgi:AcrR family transcriptional regulator